MLVMQMLTRVRLHKIATEDERGLILPDPGTLASIYGESSHNLAQSIVSTPVSALSLPSHTVSFYCLRIFRHLLTFARFTFIPTHSTGSA